jgi:hypothetical protein
VEAIARQLLRCDIIPVYRPDRDRGARVTSSDVLVEETLGRIEPLDGRLGAKRSLPARPP